MKLYIHNTIAAALLFCANAPSIAATYSIEVTGSFIGGFAPWHANPPAVNSLAHLVGASFNGIFQTDSDPDTVLGNVKAIDGNAIAWYLPNYSLSVSGTNTQLPTIYGFGTSPATENDRFFSASQTFGFVPKGFYDTFGIFGGNITGNNGCTPLDDPSCGAGSGLGFSITLFGSSDMLSDPNRPGPNTINMNAVKLVTLDASEWLNGVQIGSAYLIGTLPPSSSINNFTISAVPIPNAIWLFGSSLLGFLGLLRHRK